MTLPSNPFWQSGERSIWKKHCGKDTHHVLLMIRRFLRNGAVLKWSGVTVANIKRGEIWLVNLDPTLGHEIKKSRSGVIIQNDIGNAYSPLTIIAPLTSQIKEKIYPFEVFLPSGRAGLQKDSRALLNQIRKLTKSGLSGGLASLPIWILKNLTRLSG